MLIAAYTVFKLQENIKWLHPNAVAYINMDSVVSGMQNNCDWLSVTFYFIK